MQKKERGRIEPLVNAGTSWREGPPKRGPMTGRCIKRMLNQRGRRSLQPSVKLAEKKASNKRKT